MMGLLTPEGEHYMTKLVSFRIETSAHDALRQAAHSESLRRGHDISLSAILRQLVDNFLALRERRDATSGQRV